MFGLESRRAGATRQDAAAYVSRLPPSRRCFFFSKRLLEYITLRSRILHPVEIDLVIAEYYQTNNETSTRNWHIIARTVYRSFLGIVGLREGATKAWLCLRQTGGRQAQPGRTALPAYEAYTRHGYVCRRPGSTAPNVYVASGKAGWSTNRRKMADDGY